MNLREARRSKGFTQQELAKVSGIAQATISNIEVGKINARVGTLLTIAETLGMELVVEFKDKENGN